jgi:asparagine synthase (glutamine-hydrolysing)
MCGVAAAIGWEDAETVLRRMIEGVRHRGDVTDALVAPLPNTAMCTRRLRIVDAERGAQPKLSYDGRILVCFNGEIYNHAELRRELEAMGVRFGSESDTELLATALSVWGAGALPRFSGMYAFVAFDLHRNDFLAARDPLGVKPLYVIQSETAFLFCSEIRPLLEASETGEVMLLPPGYLLTKTLCAPFTTPFSKPASPLVRRSPQTLDALLSDAVASRIPADLPYALMFSGGIDSTLVAHYAREVRDAPAYFLGGPSSPDYEYAARYADQTRLELRETPMPDSPQDIEPLIDAVIEAVEAFEPCIIRPGLCSHVLSERISADGFRVALCGEGADELFAGYAPLEAAFADSEETGAFVREQYLTGMNRSNLQRLDRCGMRFGLEVREPFLDSAVIEYALGGDRATHVDLEPGGPRGKRALRALYDLHPDTLPAAIRDRRKTPFSEGAGMEQSRLRSPCVELAEAAISDRDFEDGRRAFADYALNDKEELYCLRKLAAVMDISRVPHLKGRLLLRMPDTVDVSALKEDILVAK